MALHLLKLIWNRKRTNALIVAELLLSFIVLAALTTVGAHYWRNYQAPLGYSYDRIWEVSVRVPRGLDDSPAVKHERLQRFARLLETTRAMPEVESVDHLELGLYRNWEWSSDIRLQDGRSVDFNGNRAGDSLQETLSIPMVDGRWFSREDNGQSWDAIVINRRLAETIFGTAHAAGRTVPVEDRPSENRPPERPMRVVGVMEDFRQFGEFSTLRGYLIRRNDIETAAARPSAPPSDEKAPRPLDEEVTQPSILILRVRPGVDAAFEERLTKVLQAQAPDWSFGMKPTVETREGYLRTNYLTPIAILGLVAGFLLLMVALGLSGVLWQSVTQRIRELGLRRAKGADRVRIRRQILGELLLMTAIAVVAGTILLAQLPVLGWLGKVSTSIFGVGLLLATTLLFLLTSFCGWYPSLLATRVPPAEALRYE